MVRYFAGTITGWGICAKKVTVLIVPSSADIFPPNECRNHTNIPALHSDQTGYTYACQNSSEYFLLNWILNPNHLSCILKKSVPLFRRRHSLSLSKQSHVQAPSDRTRSVYIDGHLHLQQTTSNIINIIKMAHMDLMGGCAWESKVKGHSLQQATLDPQEITIRRRISKLLVLI
jgi:hypothetical protein